MIEAVKAGLLLGAALLIGGGVAARFVAPQLLADSHVFRKRVWAGTLAGLGLLGALSALDLVVTLLNAIGRFDPELLWSYLRQTRHGHATQLRYLLLPIIGTLALWVRPEASKGIRRLTNAVFAGLSVLLLGTLSVTSHAASVGGLPALLVDLAHFAAACAWAGPLFYLAIYPAWRTSSKPALESALLGLSRVGLASVVVLFVSGIYSSLLHLQDPPAFVASPYGQTLGIKLVLVFVIIGLAGINRFWLLPNFSSRGASSLKVALRVELVVLAAVFVTTGVLSTSPLPHAGDSPGVLANLQTFWGYLLTR